MPLPTPDSRLLTLRDLQHQVDSWIRQFEEGYFHPLTNLARLTEEVGELARDDSRWTKKRKRGKENVSGEKKA